MQAESLTDSNVRSALARRTAVRLWKRPGVRHAVYQTLVLAALACLGWSIYANLAVNLPRANISLGFDFLFQPARFEMGRNPAGFEAGDNYLKAFWAGLLNTIRVSLLGIVLATVLGVIVALARLSHNWLVSSVAWAYIETMRNLPLLLHLLFWHALITITLPKPRGALELAPGVFVSNRGLTYPTLTPHPANDWALLALAVAIAGVWMLRRRARRIQERTGRRPPVLWSSLALLVGLPALTLALLSAPLTFEWPELSGFNFSGGETVTPEFVALLLALSIYQSGYAAETIRSGILGVSHGQIEAARSLGLRSGQQLRLVVFPQAMRIIVPPMASQYLSLTKSSSLAVAVGYPDLTRVSIIAAPETGRAIECMSILVIVYLSLSLLTALFMNWFNRRIAIVEH